MTEATPGPGHNVGGVNGDRLLSIMDRHDRLDEEVKALRQDQSDLMKEAKHAGFEPTVVKQVMRLRRMDKDKRDERDHLEALYRRVAGI